MSIEFDAEAYAKAAAAVVGLPLDARYLPGVAAGVSTMDINIPEVVAEVTAQFMRYEAALTTNDVAVLDELFWDSPHTLRYGVTENLHGHEESKAFRAGRSPAGLARELLRTVITTHGRDFATCNTTFRRTGSDRVGRQSQSWVRIPGIGWRVVAAHVSLMQAPG